MNTRSLVVTLGFLALAGATHCSSTYSSYCEKQRNCEGGNDKDEDACVERLRADENIADAYDCSDQWDKLASCRDEKSTCTNKRFSSSCSDQSNALTSCLSAATGRKSSATSAGSGG